MKISELEKQLADFRQNHGDVDVLVQMQPKESFFREYKEIESVDINELGNAVNVQLDQDLTAPV